MSALPCTLCGKRLPKRIDKNGKPYFVCDPCGSQQFIRRAQGIENLNELIQVLGKKDFPFREHALVLSKFWGFWLRFEVFGKRSTPWTAFSIYFPTTKRKSGRATCWRRVSIICFRNSKKSRMVTGGHNDDDL